MVDGLREPSALGATGAETNGAAVDGAFGTHSVENALLCLAGRCDGARALDGAGFSAYDTHFGHALAERVSMGLHLTGKQRRAAYRMLRRYSTQLGRYGVDYARIEAPPDDKPVDPVEQRGADARSSRDAVHVRCQNGRIVVRSPFKYRDVAKTIPAARWNPQEKAWTYPESPTSALAVRAAYGGADFRPDDRFQTLCAEGDRMRAASSLKTAADEELAEIPLYKGPPQWTHQKQGFWFAHAQQAAMLGMDMGTGKSRVCIDLLTNHDAKRVLIMCPFSVVDVWPKQFRLWGGVEWHVVGPGLGSIAQRVAAFDHALHECGCGKPHACVMNYEATAHEPFKTWGHQQAWDVLVMDESHRIKGGGVWARWCARTAQRSGRRLALTGTPMPQSPLDVYWQYRALDPDIFGPSFTSFKRRYGTWGGYNDYEFLGLNPQTERELNEKVYSIMFRVMARDVLDLPEDTDVTRSCSLSARARGLYRQLERDLTAEFGVQRVAADPGPGDRALMAEAGIDTEEFAEVTTPNVLVRLLRLQQLTGGAVGTDDGTAVEVDDAKERVLEDLLTDIPAGEPVVVFCRFVHDLEVVRRVAGKLGRSYGELSGRQKDLTEDATMPEGIDVMAVQEQSGGVGIDLTRARYGVFYSLGFSLGNHLQCRARLVRPGQTRPVLFSHLVAAGTVDEAVYRALESRQEVVSYVLDQLGISR